MFVDDHNMSWKREWREGTLSNVVSGRRIVWTVRYEYYSVLRLRASNRIFLDSQLRLSLDLLHTVSNVNYVLAKGGFVSGTLTYSAAGLPRHLPRWQCHFWWWRMSYFRWMWQGDWELEILVRFTGDFKKNERKAYNLVIAPRMLCAHSSRTLLAVCIAICSILKEHSKELSK